MTEKTAFRNLALVFVGIAAALPLSPLLAHHPILAKFDDADTLSLSGTVTGVDWANPHVHLFMNVEDDAGAITNWAVELASPIDLERGGWAQDTLAEGETISVAGLTARDGSDQLWANNVTRDGEALFTVNENYLEERLAGRPQGPTPRWPDGQPRLGPPAGQTGGYWAAASRASLVEDGAEVAMDEHGILEDIADASTVAPFQAWARELYILRQNNYLMNDPMYLYCLPPGGPRQFQRPYGVQFIEQRDRDRIFVLMGSGNSNWRLIYTDGREQVGQIGGSDDNPLFYGHSVARWEDNTLVIDTNGFNEKFWFSNGGLPHTQLLQLTERISRPDLNTLRYQVTVDDPGAYTRPWTSSWTLQWVPDDELPEYYCEDNRP